MLVCIYESRKNCEPGVRLLISSLTHHNHDIKIRLWHNYKTDSFKDWIKKFNNVELFPADLASSLHWNVKPEVLKRGLSLNETVMWIDSDIIVSGNISHIIKETSKEAILLTEECRGTGYSDKNALRARGWKLPIGRDFGHCLNTGVIIASRHHLGLIEEWQRLLDDPVYIEMQKKPWFHRPRHMMGDQDVLTALLSSKEFSSVEVKILRRGSDILQLFGPLGFGILDRIKAFKSNGPYFVHAQGEKPWSRQSSAIGPNFYRYINSVYADCSPYIHHSKIYVSDLHDRSWLQYNHILSRAMKIFGMNNYVWSAWPIAILFDALAILRRVYRKYFVIYRHHL